METDRKLIKISQAEYEALVRESLLLEALEASGVDNWAFYGGHYQQEDYCDGMSYEDYVEDVLKTSVAMSHSQYGDPNKEEAK